MELLPEPDKPVSQRIQPRCPRTRSRSRRVTAPADQTMYLLLGLDMSVMVKRGSGYGRPAPSGVYPELERGLLDLPIELAKELAGESLALCRKVLRFARIGRQVVEHFVG